MSERIGWIGLGRMGEAMVKRLLKGGHGACQRMEPHGVQGLAAWWTMARRWRTSKQDLAEL